MPVSTETRAAVQKIIGDTLVNARPTNTTVSSQMKIGPGSPAPANYLKAVAWGEQKFKELGLTNVHTETFKIIPGSRSRARRPGALSGEFTPAPVEL